MTSWTQNNLTLAPPSERGCPAGRPLPWCPFHPRPRTPVKPFTAVVPGHRTGPEWRGAWLKAHRNLQGNDIGYRWGDFNENPCVSWGRSAIKIVHTIETSQFQGASFSIKGTNGLIWWDTTKSPQIPGNGFKDFWLATIFGQAGAFDTTTDPIKVSLSKDLHKNDLEQPPKLIQASKSPRLWLCDTLRSLPWRRLVVFKGIVRHWTLIEQDSILIQGRGQKGLKLHH